MITAEITIEQLEAWKKIYSKNRSKLQPNRISGSELNDCFKAKYSPLQKELPEFEKAVFLNAQEHGESSPEVVTYILPEKIYVGIDLKSGFFQVECDNTQKMARIWDDLFLMRGLNDDDIENYVLAAQYVLLTGI